MDFLSTLYQLIFMPLQIIFEVIYYLVFKLISNPGISIIALSFIVNLLVLPLYNRADAMQEAERDMELKLSKGVEHIKKTFKGDEQLMMLQTYYRQNNYSPLDSIKGSISLFLEIPFFVAAYQFLSHLDLLNGASLGPIKDLGNPDGLLSIAGMSINVLPFIMTAINLASAYIFTKDLTSKTKMQLYGMACFFLVFLYASPAGLVCYWTLNNIFNLIKTVICKMEDTDKGINIAMFICSIVVAVYGVITSTNYKDVIHFSLLAFALNVRFIIKKLQQLLPSKTSAIGIKPQVKIFVMGAMFLALLIGAVIPSVVIESSPQEFLVNDHSFNPLWYLVSSVAIAIGTFVIWGGVFYWLSAEEYKVSIERTIWMFCGAAIVNYMFFGKKLGILSATLKFEEGLRFSSSERATNAVVFFALLVAMYYFWKKFHKYVYDVLVVGVIALFAMVGINTFSINDNLDDVLISNEFAVEKVQLQTTEEVNVKKIFPLSKNGKNIVIIMLDMAAGEYVPYIFNEKKEVYRQFDGFTYYNNVITHGRNTNFGTPGLFGGYEYIPVEMNKRNDILLKDKHNEALKVMPHIFYNNDYMVTVCDPPFTNYKWVTDFSIYDDYPMINKYKTIGRYFKDSKDDSIGINMNFRNFYFFGLMKSVPLCLQKYLYDDGKYTVLRKGKANHKISSIYTATNIDERFMKNYSVLLKLQDLTNVVDDSNTFMMLTNEITHAPCLLQLPEYVPKQKVDNRNLVDYHTVKGIDGNQIKMRNRSQVSHYHSNMAAFIQLGKWFDFLRSNGIFDNTRIILVSDHAWPLKHFKKLILDYGNDKENNVEWYFPLLMVKDFNSTGFNISKEFMTNADVPTLAFKGVIDNPVNPFTGNVINSLYKEKEKQYIFASKHWNPNKNNGKVFKADRWYSVHSNIWDKKNWKLEKENAILPY